MNMTMSDPVTEIQVKSALPVHLCDEELIEEIRRIPNKLGFKIGEVADLLGIKQYVLRYWETEFDILRPKKASNNQRYYTRADVENALLIRKLLYRDRFSIDGARLAMKDLKAQVQLVHRIETIHDRMENLIRDIRNLKKLFQI